MRSRWEFARGHVPGAIHMPFWLLPARMADLSTLRERPIVVYCGHGPRAWCARTLLRSRGYRDVALLDGHMAAWRRAGLREER